METLLTLLAFYLVSIFVTRKWIQRAYSEGGVWESRTPEVVDTVTVLLPGVNLITLLAHMLSEGSLTGKVSKKSKSTFTKRFFNIKNREL